MSELFPRPRSLEPETERRPARDGVPSGSQHDPLSELARLVGREDPFRDLFPKRTVARDDSTPREMRPSLFPRPESLTGYGPTTDMSQPTTSLEESADRPGGYETTEPAQEPNFAAFEHRDDEAYARIEQRDALRFPVLPENNTLFEDPHEAHFGPAPGAGEAPPLNADLWAQGMPEPVPSVPIEYGAEEAARSAAPGSSRRTLVVLAAVVALTLGGLGTTFLMRGRTAEVANTTAVPTIAADSGPTKVQPPETANAATGGDGNTALLEKSASDNVANAKVADTQERPIDLAQLPKSTPAPKSDDGRVMPPTSGSPFPEPRKVKTILIRPDGSVVGSDQATASTPAPTPATVADIAAAQPPATTDAAAVPRAATPKSTARVTATPKSTVDGVAPVKPKPSHAAAKLKPVETADVAETPAEATATASSGGFAVQLGAPGSEQEAKDIVQRLEKKLADALGGHKLSFRKAEKGDKSVYRVRVGSLSQDDAKAMCTKIQSSGGSCFVVRN